MLGLSVQNSGDHHGPTVTRPGVAQVTPGTTPTPAPARPQTTSRRIVTSISADAGKPRAKIHARVGDVLALQVRGDVVDSVEIPDAGKVEPIEPGSPAHFELLLDRRGELRIGLVDAERQIGVVEVSPARS